MNRILSLFAIVLMLSFAGVSAQQTTGTISGTVIDETGGVLPGVSVTGVNTGTGLTRSVISDDEGRYRLLQLVPGNYQVRAELAGFQTAVVEEISLSMTQEAVIGIILRVGEITEQVVVSAEVALIETTTASVAALVDQQTIRDLPLNGRDFIQLAALQEGVVTPTSARSSIPGDVGVKVSIGGTRPDQTAILLDGTDIKNNYGMTPGGVSGALLGVETVREFRVITNAYSAEYGRFTGGVISAVTRSGTNEIHGSVFEFLRNSALDARNFFDRDPKNPLERGSPPPFKRNQFGFTLGGPIKQDQTFIFGSMELLRERLTLSQISTFPTADAKNGILPNFRSRGSFICGERRRKTQDVCQFPIDPLSKPYLDHYPTANGEDFGDGTGEFIFDQPNITDEDYFVVKVDHQLSDSDSFFVRYTYDDSIHDFVTGSFIYGRESFSRSQYLTIEEKHVFSPNLLNEVRVAFNRSRVGDEDVQKNVDTPTSLFFRPDRPSMGDLIVSGLTQFGTTTFTPAEHIQNTFQYMDNLIWTRGDHSLKMGVSWTHWQYNIALQSRLNGTFSFNGVRELILNTPRQATLFFSDPFRAGLRANLIGLYLQDDIDVSPNLTVNLGVRYEFITVPTEVNGKLGNIQDPFQVVPSCPAESVATAPKPCTASDAYFRNPSLMNFSPRVGFSWDPTWSGKSSIRGGFGLFHHQITPAMYSTAPHRMAPFATVASLNSGDPRVGAFKMPTAVRTLTADSPGVTTPDVQVVTDPADQAYLMQWNLSLQREILPQTSVTATYTGSRGVHLPRGSQVNAPIGEQQADGRWFFPDGIQRHNPGYAGILSYLWDGQSWYNGLRLGLRRRFSEGFQYQLSYQFQKFMDDGSSVSVRRKDFVNSSTSSQYWLDKTLDRALSSYDTTHIFSSNFSVDLPGSGLGGAAGLVLGGWRFNGIISLSTGPPLEIGGDGNATCGFCASRPNLRPGAPNNPNTGDPNAWFGPIAQVLSDDPTDCLTEGSSSFTLCTQEQGFFGNLGRNTASMPGLANLDVSIQKNFSIGETADVQFRAEFFNVLNRVNFGVPSRGTFSRGRPNAAFGRITSTNTTSRQIQFALKIIF